MRRRLRSIGGASNCTASVQGTVLPAVGNCSVSQCTSHLHSGKPICSTWVLHVGCAGHGRKSGRAKLENDAAHVGIGHSLESRGTARAPEVGDFLLGGPDGGCLWGLDSPHFPVPPLPPTVGTVEETPQPTIERAVALIKKWEGFREQAYWDYSRWSIGYGTSATEGQVITEVEAEKELREHVTHLVKFISDDLPSNCSNRIAGLASFAYNVGLGAYRRSTLRKAMRVGDLDKVSVEFSKWVKANGVVIDGLKNRRREEAAIVSSPCESD